MPSSRVSRGSLHLGRWVGRKQAGAVGRYERQPRPELRKKATSPEKQGDEKKTTKHYCSHRCVSLCACCAGSAMRPGFCVIFIRPRRTGRENTAFSSRFLG